MDTTASAITPRAVKYRRVSTLMQKQHGYSLGAQSKDLDRLADELSAEVVADFEDNDSGAEWDLPGLTTVLDMARQRQFDLLLVPDPDRFARSMAKQLVLEDELKRFGVAIHYVALRIEDSAEGRLLKNVRASVSEYEREKINLRTLRGRREKAERGLVVGCGVAPYGYRYVLGAKGKPVGLEIVPELAEVVRRIFHAAQRMPTADIASWLVAEGVPGPRRPWSDAAVLRIVNSTTYLGSWIYGHRGRRIHPDQQEDTTFTRVTVPAIVDRATWDAAQEALRRRQWVRPPRRPIEEDAWILRGMLTCGFCGGALSTRTNANNMGGEPYRYYACLRSQPHRVRTREGTRCTGRDVLAAPLEGTAWCLVVNTLLDVENLRKGLAAVRAEHEAADVRRRERVGALDAELARLRTRLSRTLASRLDADEGGEMDRALLAQARDIEGQIARLSTERQRLDAPSSVGLSEEAATSIETFVTETCHGIVFATPAERRRLFQTLDLRATVRVDPHGTVKIGRKYRYSITWEAKIPLVNHDASVNDHVIDCFRYGQCS